MARPRLPWREGEEAGSFCRVALLANSGGGIGLSVVLEKVFAINVDLTLTLWRELPGEWVFIPSRTAASTAGSGLVESLLGDTGGIGGLALQTMLMSTR